MEVGAKLELDAKEVEMDIEYELSSLASTSQAKALSYFMDKVVSIMDDTQEGPIDRVGGRDDVGGTRGSIMGKFPLFSLCSIGE